MEHQATWLTMQGANYPALYLESTQWPGELRTRQEIVEGQLLLHVPRATLITLDDAKASPIGQKIAAQGSGFSDPGYLAAFLLEAILTDSPHRAYADALLLAPCPHPLLGGDPVVQQLKGCAASALLSEQRKKLLDDYRTLQSCWQEGLTPGPGEFARLYCAAMIRSDLYTIDKKQTLTLLPLLDMPTHSFTPNPHLVNEASCGAILIAASPIATEQAVLICRGRQSNSILFACYGIEPDGASHNPHDDVAIDFPAPAPAHPLHAMLERLGRIDEGSQFFRLTRNLEDDSSATLLSFLRLVCLEDMPAIMRMMTSSVPVNRIPFISEKNEQGAWELLDAACARALQRYEQHNERDEGMPAEEQSGRQQPVPALLEAARRVSAGEQGILKEYREKYAANTRKGTDGSREA